MMCNLMSFDKRSLLNLPVCNNYNMVNLIMLSVLRLNQLLSYVCYEWIMIVVCCLAFLYDYECTPPLLHSYNFPPSNSFLWISTDYGKF
jgi:hypothetical protein